MYPKHQFSRSCLILRAALSLSLALHLPALRAADSSLSPSNQTPLVVNGQSRCAIVSPADDLLLQRAASRLAEYLREHTGTQPPIVTQAEMLADPHPVLIALDGAPNHPLLRQLGVTLDVPGDRPDAYHLQVVSQDKRTIIAVAGQSPAGAKFGTYRLMEEMDLSQGFATVPNLDIALSPFFKTRSVSLFNIWRVPVEIIRQCNLESWPAAKIELNVDMYDAFGFNALETHDRFHEDFLKAVYGITRAQWRDKVYALCDRAHENGMTVFLRQWGNSVALPVKEITDGHTPFGFVNLVPDIPEERKRWEAEIRDYTSTNYASHVEHLIGHWADASGVHPGSHATLKDALLLHNELRAAFRAINPRIETSFSLWNMAKPRGIRGWPGYVDHRSVTTPGILEKDVIIAQATRAFSHPYSAKVTQDILQDSYRAAVWTWRRGDTEVRLGDPGLRIRIHGVMGRYFHDLPESARQLEWHNIERNHHGIANDVNYFVAAKLMWDPKTDVDAALQKYCALVFGPPNAKPVAEAFLTVEASRDLENQVSKTMQANWDEGAKRARQALAALAAVKLPSSHHSRLPSVTSPQEMLAELRASLTVIAENAELCAKTLPAIDALIQAGKLDQAKALAKVVRKKTDPWFDTLAGGMEGLWLRETLQAKIEPGAPEKIKEWFGFRTFNLADFEQKGSDFVISGRGKGAPAIALLDIEPPAQHRIEFHLQCRLAQEGKSRNGGFAFGQAVAPTKLIRCQVFGRGHQLRLSGQNLVRPIVVEAPNLDPDKPIDCAVLVDLDQHRLTFKAGEYVASGELQESVRQLRFYGYIVENTKTQFSRIAIKQSE